MPQTAGGWVEVSLQMDYGIIKCTKQLLMDNSDYFKIMFGGNFMEATKQVIDIKGVDLKTMTLLIYILQNKQNISFSIDNKDLPALLEASCMFQFLEIKEMCIQRLLETLSSRNYIQTWLLAEKLGIETLYSKAKTMALKELDSIKALGGLNDLNLHQLDVYLANTSLYCNEETLNQCEEMPVFEIFIKWWYHNAQKLPQEFTSEQMKTTKYETLLYLLSCLDFNLLDSEYDFSFLELVYFIFGTLANSPNLWGLWFKAFN